MRRLLFLVGGIVFVDTMFFVALTPLLPDYAEEYDLSKAGVGVLAGAYPIGALVGGIPGGIATARFGARPTTIAGVLVIARHHDGLRDGQLDPRPRRSHASRRASAARSPGPPA